MPWKIYTLVKTEISLILQKERNLKMLKGRAVPSAFVILFSIIVEMKFWILWHELQGFFMKKIIHFLILTLVIPAIIDIWIF